MSGISSLRLRGLSYGPKGKGILVFNEDAVAYQNGIGVGLLIGDFDIRQFDEFLVAWLEDTELRFGS
jgi:hypothetical protein